MTDTIQAPVVKAQMLIRKPIAQVFEAFADPAVTSRFWFSKWLDSGYARQWGPEETLDFCTPVV